MLVAAVSACAPDAVFHCTSTQQCRANELAGTCETSGFCSFPDSSCPSGSRYMDGAGELASECVEVSSGVDRDHDGVPDAGDNCPDLANPDQGNEDGDTLGDVCDPCPTVANEQCVAPANLILFEGFHHGLPATWTITGGTVAVSGDSLVITPDASATALLTIPFTSTTPITVSAGVSPVMLPAAGATSDDGIVAATDGTHAVVCELDDTMAGQTLKVEDTTNFGVHAAKPWSFQVQVPYTLTATWDLANQVSCEVSNGSTSTSAAITLPATLPASWHRIGIYAVAMPLRIDWVMLTSL